MKKTENNETRTGEMVTISRAEYEEKNARLAAQDERISRLEHQIEVLMEALRLARHKRFGASSEKTSSEEDYEQLSLLFNEAEVCAPEESSEGESVSVAGHRRHKKHEYTLEELPENIPVEVVEHRLPEEELECPECGEVMEEIGKEVRRRLKLIPAKVVVLEDHYYSYACRRCSEENVQTPVVKMPQEPNFLPGSFATPEAAAHLMTQKCMSWALPCTAWSRI